MIALARRFWWLPIILGLSIALMVQRAENARLIAKVAHYGDVMKLTETRIRATQAAATAKDQANARRVETAQAKASQETSDALLPQLEDARAAARRYADQLRARTAQGAVGQPHLPYAADAALGADAASDPTELDALACADAVIKAEGWQAWWKRVVAIPR